MKYDKHGNPLPLEHHATETTISESAILAALTAGTTRIEELQRALEISEAKRTNRPGNGGMCGGGALEQAMVQEYGSNIARPITSYDAETQGFWKYLSKGDTTEVKSFSAGSLTDGGYAIPHEIETKIIATQLKHSPIRANASVVFATSGDYNQLVSDSAMVQGWATETSARIATGTPKLANIKIPLFSQYAFPQATRVMLDDIYFDGPKWISDLIGANFGERESFAFLLGDGTTQPAGILNCPTALTADYAARAAGSLQYLPSLAAAGFAAGTASTSPVDVLLNLVAALKPSYRIGAKWYLHPTTLALVMSWKDQQGRFVCQPNLIAGNPTMLLGYPVVEAEHMPLVAAGNLAIMFANLMVGYRIVDRPGVGLLRDELTNKPYIGFWTEARVGGAVVMADAIKVVKIGLT